MKHHKQGRTLGRVRRQRTALLRSLARELVLRGKIRTTEAKAKEVRPFIEKLVTRAKKDSVLNRRILLSSFGGGQEAIVSKLITERASNYTKRAGGYTRIIKIPSRKSDNAKMAVIEFV